MTSGLFIVIVRLIKLLGFHLLLYQRKQECFRYQGDPFGSSILVGEGGKPNSFDLRDKSLAYDQL